MQKKFKTLVGIDSEGTYGPALELCQRLKFEGNDWTLVNTIPPLPWYVPGLSPRILPVAEEIDYLRDASEKLLQKVRQDIRSGEVATVTDEGDVSASLIRASEAHDAELIVLGSGVQKHGFFWMLGSVARSLSINSPRSLLVTKGKVDSVGPLHAVFATDHSEYANGALEQLLAWNPQGIERLDVLTAYDINPATTAMLKRDTDVSLDFEAWVKDHARALTEKAVEKARSRFSLGDAVVSEGEPNTVIREYMKLSGADLLIVGAQGHGFFDRMVIGSVSHHQMLAEPYPVLLIRLPNFSDS